MCELCLNAEADGRQPLLHRRAVLMAGLAACVATVTSCGARQPRQALRYIVAPGDSLSSIARRSGLSVSAIISANDLRSRLLRPGQELWLPGVRSLEPEPVADPYADLIMVSRVNWGALPLRDNYDPMGGIERLTLHHTSEIPGMMDLRDGELIQAVQRFHQSKRGWADLGYHYLIGRDGRIYEGRPLYAQGAHAGGDNNKHNIGVALVGDWDKRRPGSQQLHAAKRFLDRLKEQHGLRNNQPFAHRDFKVTVCPGDQLYAWFQGYRRDALV